MSDFHSESEEARHKKVQIDPAGWVVLALPGKTVLQAALQAQIELPSACRNGTCRSCICQLISGDVRYLVDWPGVSTEERQTGLFLPCVAVAQTDIVLDQPLAIRGSTSNVT